MVKNIKRLTKTVFVACLVATILITTDFSALAATETEVEKEYLVQQADLANVKVIDGEWKLENDIFSLTKKDDETAGDGWFEAFIGSEEWTDYVVEFDLVQAIDGGIWFRASTTDGGAWGGLNAYMLGSDGIYIYLAKCTNGQFATMSDSSQAVQGGKPFATQYTKMWDAHWKLVVEGNVFSVYVDGSDEPVIQATDSDFASGCVGFNYDAPLEGEPSTEIANFEVYRQVEKTVEGDTQDKTDDTQDKTDDTQDKTDDTQTGAEEKPSDSNKGVIIGIIIVAVVVIGAVVVIAVANKKKKSAK